MKSFASLVSSAMVILAGILLFSASQVLADSYTIYDLGSDNARGIYGIDGAGDVVTWGTTGCALSSSYCYSTYVDGVPTSDGGTAPVLGYDNGAACGSTPAGFNVLKSVCNNGWMGFGATYNPNGDPNGVYLASGSGIDFLGYGSADHIFLNSAGDFAWVDGLDDQIYVAIQNAPVEEFAEFSAKGDVITTDPVPEPGSLLLLGTGLIAVTIGIRVKGHS
jgi:PEP-CTERM motif